MINLTPHTVSIIGDTEEFTFPPSGYVARVAMTTTPSVELTREVGLPIHTVEYGEAEVPPEFRGKDLIVSSMFADAYRTQHGFDGQRLFVPDSGPSAIREDGQIRAVRQLLSK